jgi:hypothetical protein
VSAPAGGPPAAEKADHWHRRQPRKRRERPRGRRAAEQRYELAAFDGRAHSITSSARVSSVGGTVMPSNCEQQAYHWRSPSWAKYTIVNIRWKRTQRDFSGNLLKTAKIKGSINSTPLTFHK